MLPLCEAATNGWFSVRLDHTERQEPSMRERFSAVVSSP